jgi:hypothetical protein
VTGWRRYSDNKVEAIMEDALVEYGSRLLAGLDEAVVAGGSQQTTAFKIQPPQPLFR